MIGIGLSIQIKKSKVITEAARALALPLTEVTQMLAARILPRIARGQGPNGPWNTYAAGPEQDSDSLFWVAPDRPQYGTPGEGGFRFRLESGKWAGWAAYESDRDYYRLGGKLGKPHDFNESGEFLRKAVVRIVSARHTRLAFYGSHGKLSAKQLSWLVSRDEAYPLLMPSKSEVQEAQAFLVGRINEQVVDAARMSEGAQRLTSKSRSINRRTSKLLGD